MALESRRTSCGDQASFLAPYCAPSRFSISGDPIISSCPSASRLACAGSFGLRTKGASVERIVPRDRRRRRRGPYSAADTAAGACVDIFAQYKLLRKVYGRCASYGVVSSAFTQREASGRDEVPALHADALPAQRTRRA